MRKKLLAGILALALCSANMPIQTIFAEEFTSGNPDIVSEEETPEIFTNEEQETAGETDEELSVFSSEEVPEFNDTPDEAMAAAENTQIKEIDLINSNEVKNGVYTISSAGDYKFTCSNSQETANRIVVDGTKISEKDNIKIYLDNVNINTSAGPALQINYGVEAIVTIYLTGTNNLITKNNWYAGLQKVNKALLRITTNALDTTAGILNASSIDGDGAGIGGGLHGSCSNITIDSVSVIASSKHGAGIGGGNNGTGSNIIINSGSVTASSTDGAGIGGGINKAGSNITINSGSVTASSTDGAGIGGGEGGSCENIIINGGSVNASSVSVSPKNNQGKDVYCCTINNPGSLKVKVDGSPWTPVNHKNVDPNDTNLYAWLTGEDHVITVGENETSYIFDSESNKFKSNITPTITAYTGTYDGMFHPVVKIDQTTIPPDSIIEYSVDNKQTWKILDSSNPIPTVKTVEEAKNTKIYIRISNSNYYTWTSDEYKATISPATQAPNFPSDPKISVPWSCKKVGDIKDVLKNDWKWSDSDISRKLPVGEEISARAVYNGADAGNYLDESVEFKITRRKCTHEHTAGRYYSSPSCTSSGYSGDTYCTDCNETLSYGYTISAYGHDYDNGVITTEPTAEIDGIITYTCKRCKHQDTKILGKLGDGEPYIEGSFQKKGWDAVNDLIKASKEKDTISIIMNGARTLPASVLSGIKGKDISLNLDMENGFIWKINGTSITTETPADTDLSVTNTAEYIPAALYSLISTNQNDFGFHLGRSGAFDFPAVLSVKADASCAGLMANLFWYDVENGVLQCIQTVTVGGAFERSIPYADFTLSKGQDYFIAFGTESLNGRVIHTDGSITDENGAYLRPADAKISSHSIDRNKLTVKLAKGCAGAQGYDFVISKKSNMLRTGKFSKTVSSTGKPQASFRYLAKGTWYVAARSWVLDAQGNKVYGSWTKVKKIKITVVTSQQPKIRDITVKGNTVTVTYTKCKNATGYEILLGTKYKTSAGEKYPVKKYVKRTEGKNTVTVTFTNIKKGTWYVTVRSWNKTSKDKSRVYSPYSAMKKFKTKK
ncbi:hypothetical protein [Blautia wexlerae]|uniref:hypothetical protein n=1 Tax=Blautia wexlerae TaxID=418240 RepID=UPI00232CBBA7|nr:hypothetical protein [Blautia wexlerae]MDB2176452.1 hypothetical protein [Blautia wexlerae]MDB6439686.1 hypothetical protein [Blautia wexlerae]